MNFIENESPQKLRGGFYTEPDIADFLTRWVLQIGPSRLLEPSCGDGAFIESVLRNRGALATEVLAFDIDPAEAEKARARASKLSDFNVKVRTGDFLEWFLFHSHASPRFDGVLGNPPFIRYQYLNETMQSFAEKIIQRFSLPFTKHTNAWVPFVIASVALLIPGGRLGMVIPSEIFHIPHAQSLREFLVRECSRILIIDPEELWFSEALQGVVLLLAEKKLNREQEGVGVAVQPAKSRAILCGEASGHFDGGQYVRGKCLEGKWMSLFLTHRERSLLDALHEEPNCSHFGEVASVDVGIVTGANSFFLVPDAVVESYGLQKWAHPMFGRSDHVSGVIFTASDHAFNRRAGLPANFLWLSEDEVNAYPGCVQDYIRLGEAEGLPKRFKCRVRTPWYKVPSVYSAPVAMLKRSHHFPRLVLNKAKVLTTDTAYRILPKKMNATSLVSCFVTSLTALSAELEGRHYGGGVLELVPSEIERLLLAKRRASQADLKRLDSDLRSHSSPLDILRRQDAFVLRGIGLTKCDCAILHEAWERLRNRRQRNSNSAESGQDISMKKGELLPAEGA